MNEKSSCPVLRGLGGSNAPRLPGVEKKSTRIYSQVKSCSSSEVAAPSFTLMSIRMAPFAWI